MAKVESFTLDHTKVKAPYVRLITTETRNEPTKPANGRVLSESFG